MVPLWIIIKNQSNVGSNFNGNENFMSSSIEENMGEKESIDKKNLPKLCGALNKLQPMVNLKMRRNLK